ncbi:MAG TPA: rod shape-determining protein MreD [Bacillus bacterium]|uniref:rod shape-determining protein MreD n=1 Tax=Siminovitchia fordii TaxID=254759 RepID=UPI00035EB0A5|nr:rod shape-determining protein MreD [Siminovitchia fordii]HBZ09619.1 rod shape-determining protein MreD [Bacillus sp. (in: firmicutes)]
MKRYVLPLITIICFYAESLFVEFFPAISFLDGKIVVPRFLLVVLIMMGIYYFRNVTLIYAAIFGLLFDIYFTGVIGAYLFIFPIAVYAASKMMKVFQINILTSGLAILIIVALAETLIYALNILLFDVKITTTQFLYNRLIPTLILNLIFYLLIFFPLSRWLQNRQKELLSE